MGIKITDMTPRATADGTEIIPTSTGAAPFSVTAEVLKDYVIAAIEAISAAGSVAGTDSVLMIESGSLKPADIDLVAQHAIDTVWGKAAETAPDGLDVVPLLDGATEKTVTLAKLAEYVRSAVEAAILDVSDLADGSGTLAVTDYMLVTQGTTAKQITVQDLYDEIYTGLAAHVTAKTDIVTLADADELYVVRAGAPYKCTLLEVATYAQASLTLSGSGTTDFLADWADANTLRAGPAVTKSTTGFTTGADTAIPTSAAVRGEMDEIVNDATDIGAALADADEVLVYDATATAQRKSLVSRIWTYILAKIVAVTDVSTWGFVLDEDTLVSDDATKLATQQSIKAYVDAQPAWDGNIADVDLDGGTDIGAALVDADLILVDDGAVGTNRKSAISRVWTYILGKLQAETDVSTHSWVIDEDTMVSNLATKVPTQQSVKAYVDSGAVAWDGDIADIDLDGGIDIGAALVDADLMLVDDGAVGTNRKSAISRMWTYIESKLQAVTSLASYSWMLDEDTMSSDDATKVPSQQSTKAYVDNSHKRYKNLWVPAGAMRPSAGATGCAALATHVYASSTRTYEYLAFDGLTQNEVAEFDIAMPDDWDRGTIKFKLFWSPGDAAANVGEYIGFNLYAEPVTDDDPLIAGYPTGTPQLVTDQVLADDDMHVTAASPAITPTTPAIGDLVHFLLERDYDYAGAGSAMDVDAWVFGVQIQYYADQTPAAW